jgi:hypothetical protein
LRLHCCGICFQSKCRVLWFWHCSFPVTVGIKKAQWTEVEIELLVQLEGELSEARFINKAIAERIPSKTNKQISDKRKCLRSQGKSNAKTTKLYTLRIFTQFNLLWLPTKSSFIGFLHDLRIDIAFGWRYFAVKDFSR